MKTSAKWTSKFKLKSDTWVFIPTPDTFKKGRLIKRLIEAKWRPPENYYHLKSGGHVDAIKHHVDGKFFIHADLKKFFSRINRSRITRELKPLFGYQDARIIAMDSTVPIVSEDLGKVYALPFGFVQSTLIASICLHKSKLGRIIQQLDHTPGIKISVYMDDIIVSTQDLAAATEALALIQRSAERSELPLNERKLEGPAANITAFNIDLAHSSILISDERLAAFIDAYMNSENESQRSGIFGYIESVNPDQALGLKATR